jgi:hypothetical protein
MYFDGCYYLNHDFSHCLYLPDDMMSAIMMTWWIVAIVAGLALVLIEKITGRNILGDD